MLKISVYPKWPSRFSGAVPLISCLTENEDTFIFIINILLSNWKGLGMPKAES